MHTRRRAFSLVELVAVMSILGVLSLAAIPAMGTLETTRRRAAGTEIERRLLLARAWATSTGQPAGLRVNTAAGTLELLRIATSGAAPTAIPGPTGQPDANATLLLSQVFPGVAISSISVTPSGDSAVWFDYDGEPQSRTPAGTLVGDLTADATIAITSGPTVTIKRLTGLVQQ